LVNKGLEFQRIGREFGMDRLGIWKRYFGNLVRIGRAFGKDRLGIW